MGNVLILSPLPCLDYALNPENPETPERLLAVIEGLRAFCGPSFCEKEARLATEDELLFVHDRAYIQKTFDLIPQKGLWALDDETTVAPLSGKAALFSVGAGLIAVDAVLSDAVSFAFCATRPPGHHASIANSGGFCLFNKVAIAARYACRSYGLERVAIIDFDVHHGNGTQDIFWNDPNVLFISIHQLFLDTQKGLPEEKGAYGNILNVPLPKESDGKLMQEALHGAIKARLESFRPRMIFVSAGFDAHKDDPLGGLLWTEKDFAVLGSFIRDVSSKLCENRVVAMLEGGYDPKALSASVNAFVGAFL